MSRRVKCDQCGQEIILPNRDGLSKPWPWPWRQIATIGWAAQFVVCGSVCEAEFKARYERPEACPPPPPNGLTPVPTPVSSTSPPSRDDEDTNPNIEMQGRDKENEDE